MRVVVLCLIKYKKSIPSSITAGFYRVLGIGHHGLVLAASIDAGSTRYIQKKSTTNVNYNILE